MYFVSASSSTSTRERFEIVTANGIAARDADLDNDPTTDDWNQPLTVRHSRRRSEFDGS